MSRPVAINARAAVRREIGGVERVAREMAKRLPRLNEERYRVIEPHPALAHRAGHAWEQLALPVRARRAELIYSPANLAPLAGGERNVVVIHDVAALRFPEWYTRGYVVWQRRLLPAVAKRARHIVTVSEFSRGEIARVLEIPPERISVVPNGVDERFTPDAGPSPRQRPYALVVGTRIARKNFAALAEASRQLDAAGIELVAAGSGRAYMRAGIAAPVHELGYVDDAELPALYAGARALAMPSLYEGFGLPCLEAMASGTPVVAADRGALPETCGDAALLVDPDDAHAFADALMSACTDDAVRAPLTEAGRARAANLTWDRAAELTDTMIGELLAT